MSLIKKLLFEDDINICTKSLHKIEEENHLNTPYSEREELYKSLADKRLPILIDVLDSKMVVPVQISAETVLNSNLPLSQQKSRKFLLEKHNDSLMMTTVKVFANIFTSDKLNDKNKL
jgi:hypothetical protein